MASSMTIPQALELGLEHHRAGRWREAEAIYRQVLAADPNQFDALHLLGILAHGAGRPDAAVDLIGRAVQIEPNVADAQANLGGAFRALGRFDEAAQHYRIALRLCPKHAGALYGLAIALVEMDQLQEAVNAWRQLIELTPQREDVHSNLGVTLERLGRLDEALVACRKAVEINPKYAGGWVNLGSVQTKLGLMQDGVASLRRAIDMAPELGAAYYNLSFAFLQLGAIDDAVAAAKRATELQPGDFASFRNLGAALQELGRLDEAAVAYDRAVEILEQGMKQRPRPQFVELAARMRAAAATMLPAVYESLEEVDRHRARVIAAIDRLERDGVKLHLVDEPAPTLFGLAYQGKDDKEIQKKYARLMAPLADPPLERRKCGSSARIKIGFISRFFKMHTIGQLNRGLVAELSRDDFDVTVLSVGDSEHDDAVSRFMQEKADRFVSLSTIPHLARQSIIDQKLDILFYADIGMDPVTYSLACSRLAPVQCVTWGHPVTTGLETTDYFISSQALDPPGNEAHYTEKLVRPKRLGVYYYRPAAPGGGKDFGLPEGAHLYGCLQMLWKFHPEFDEILAGVLRRDPLGRVLLIHGLSPHWDQKLLGRFARTMPDVVDRVVFLPRQSREDFLSLTALCDVMLDPIHFGGGNTSYEAFAFGVPTVTLPSPFLRGRITLAQYEMMGITDCVAKSPEDYVELAVALGCDEGRRRAMKEKILSASGVLFENIEAVRELEDFFRTAIASVT